MASVDPGALRRCLGRFATGVAIVSFDSPAGPRGLTVNSFTSVSLDPPLVLVCIGKAAKAHAGLDGSGFAVNVLASGQESLARHFAGRPDPEAPIQWLTGSPPRLAASLAWLDCAPWRAVEAGDHSIVIGRVTGFATGEGDDGLGYFMGRFVPVPHAAA